MWGEIKQLTPITRRQSECCWAAMIESAHALGLLYTRRNMIDDLNALAVGETVRVPGKESVYRPAIEYLRCTEQKFFSREWADNKRKYDVTRVQ